MMLSVVHYTKEKAHRVAVQHQGQLVVSLMGFSTQHVVVPTTDGA